MCELCAAKAGEPRIARRNFLRIAGIAAGLAIAPRAFAKGTKAPPKPENVLSPDAALDRLMKGNARYVDGLTKRHDFKHEREVLSKGQNPFAAVLSCANSRIAPELCFDTARGDVFVCRVAGNFANDDIVASLEYAVQVLNTPLIMVLGHERLRRGRRHYKVDQGWYDAARASACAGRCAAPCRRSGQGQARRSPCQCDSHQCGAHRRQAQRRTHRS